MRCIGNSHVRENRHKFIETTPAKINIELTTAIKLVIIS